MSSIHLSLFPLLYPMYLKDASGKDLLDANGNRQFDYGENGRPSLTDYNPLAGLYEDKSYNTYDNASVRTYMSFGSDKDSFGWAKGLNPTLNFGADYVSGEQTTMMNRIPMATKLMLVATSQKLITVH